MNKVLILLGALLLASPALAGGENYPPPYVDGNGATIYPDPNYEVINKGAIKRAERQADREYDAYAEDYADNRETFSRGMRKVERFIGRAMEYAAPLIENVRSRRGRGDYYDGGYGRYDGYYDPYRSPVVPPGRYYDYPSGGCSYYSPTVPHPRYVDPCFGGGYRNDRYDVYRGGGYGYPRRPFRGFEIRGPRGLGFGLRLF